MIIHNFFSDLMLSVYELFENYIFDNKIYFFQNVIENAKPKHFFRHVEFNIGNRNHQIGDYRKSNQLEFPTAIFSLVSDETAFGKTGHLLGHHRIWDVNEIVCTYNNDTKIEVRLREEQAIIYLTVQINCESQLQANEIVHQIKRFLPPTKYEQLAPFSSFMQIPSYFFNREYNDPEKHNIDNLYLTYDGTTGEKNYFFLSHYKPMIKLNSVNAEISDNSSRSFVVLCDFSYLIQLPMWLFDTYDDKIITRIDLGLNIAESNSSIIMDNDFLSTTDKPFQINNIYYKIIHKYIFEYNTSHIINDKIVLPKPNKDFALQISKLYQKKSTVVNWAGCYKFHTNEVNLKIENLIANINNLKYLIDKNTAAIQEIKKEINQLKSYNFQTNEIKTEILDDEYYNIQKNESTGDDEIVIDISQNEDLQPSLNSPVIISIIVPINSIELEKKQKSKTFFDYVYTVRKTPPLIK